MSQADLGPFTKKIFLPEKTINRMALDALTETKLLPESPGPVDIDKFCIRKWGWEEQFVDLGPAIMGQCAFSEDGVESIEINLRLLDDKSRTGRVRVRSTKGHEIGHGLAHKELFALKLRQERLQPQLFGGRPVHADHQVRTIHACREDQIIRPPKKEWWEVQANMLMTALLLPTPLLRQVVDASRARYARDRKRWPPPSIPPAIEVAEIFDVSFQMAEIAVKEMLAAIQKENQQMAAELDKL